MTDKEISTNGTSVPNPNNIELRYNVAIPEGSTPLDGKFERWNGAVEGIVTVVPDSDSNFEIEDSGVRIFVGAQRSGADFSPVLCSIHLSSTLIEELFKFLGENQKEYVPCFVIESGKVRFADEVLISAINKIAEQQQSNPDSPFYHEMDGFIELQKHEYSNEDGNGTHMAVRLRDDATQSTLDIIENPSVALLLILQAMKKGVDIVDAVKFIKSEIV